MSENEETLDEESIRILKRKAKARERKTANSKETKMARADFDHPDPNDVVVGSGPRAGLSEDEKRTMIAIIDYFSRNGLFPHPYQVNQITATGERECPKKFAARCQRLMDKGYLSYKGPSKRRLIPVGIELVARFTDDEAGRKLALALDMPIGDWSN